MNNIAIHLAMPSKDIFRGAKFYNDALDFIEAKRMEKDGVVTNLFLTNNQGFNIELVPVSYLPEQIENEFYARHLAIETDDYDALYARHVEMGIVCNVMVENKIYFIKDLDGNYMEILNKRRFEF